MSLSPHRPCQTVTPGGQSVLGVGKGPPAGRELVLSFLDLLLRFAFFFVIPVLSHHWIFLFF